MVITNFGGLSSRDLTNIANVVPQKEVIRTHQKVKFTIPVEGESTSKSFGYDKKDASSDWIAAGKPFVFVYQDRDVSVGLPYYINVYYIWTLRRPVINSEKCFFNNNPGNNDDLGLWLGDSSHIIIYLGQVKRHVDNNSYVITDIAVDGTRSYQFIEFY